jgi:hypothetical protein
MNIQEIGCEDQDVDSIYLKKDWVHWLAVVNAVMNLLVP